MRARAIIHNVEPGSLAAEAGIRPGDTLLTINRQRVRDLIDYRFLEADDEPRLELEREGKPFSVTIEKDYDAGLGCVFEEATFDGVRRCANHCLFCFVDRLPPRLRPSLYIKDDDYRLSFLHGNFVTLTNLRESDWRRIEEQGLSPLYVSVHSTDGDLRRRLLGDGRAPEIMAQLRRLDSIGVVVHAQVVLLPGVNDGEALARTVSDLSTLDNVHSIGVVPVGLTSYCPRKPKRPGQPAGELRRYSPAEAEKVLSLVKSLQKECHAVCGRYIVQAADEFYLLAGRAFPAASRYEGFPQLENGIGMARRFLDDWSRMKRLLSGSALAGGPLVLLTGTLFAPVLRRVALELGEAGGLDVEVVPVENSLLGPSVTVAGLLSGADLLAAARDSHPGSTLLVPRSALDDSGERFLDDITLDQFRQAVGRPVLVARYLSELGDLLANRRPV